MGTSPLKRTHLYIVLNGVLWTFTKSSRLRFWFTVNQRCILSLSDFSFRLVFRYWWTVDLDVGCCISVSFVASALVEWCPLKVHFEIAIFATRLKDDFCPRPVQFSSASWGTRALLGHGWGISARAHVHTALLYLRNGSADWVQFWSVSWGS